MKAILKTLCGCERKLYIPFPANSRIYISLKNQNVEKYLFDMQSSDAIEPTRTREFKLISSRTISPAYYLEENEY